MAMAPSSVAVKSLRLPRYEVKGVLAPAKMKTSLVDGLDGAVVDMNLADSIDDLNLLWMD